MKTFLATLAIFAAIAGSAQAHNYPGLPNWAQTAFESK
jgi:hypothetical protein